MIQLNDTEMNWEEAKQFCMQQFSGGRLAFDMNNETNKILEKLMEAANTDKAWLAASTEPMYWNWSPSKHGKISNEEV